MRNVVVSLVLSLLVACRPSLPPVSSSDAAFAAAEVVEPPGIDDTAPAAFVVLPGDIVAVRLVSLETTEATGLLVDEAGVVNVPLVGPVEVGGLTMRDAEARITEEAHRVLDRHARATLVVSDPAGHKATLTGAVEHPGPVAVRPGIRLAEVLATVGGPKTREVDGRSFDLADVASAKLVRGGVAVPVSVGRALTGDPRHNVRVRAGDIVYLPPAQGREVTVLGSVKNAKVIPFFSGLRLSAALAMAGGAAREADEGDVRVIRGSLSSPRVYRASLADLVAGRGADVELRAGDVVYVTEHWFATTTDVVQRLTPVLVGAALGASLAK